MVEPSRAERIESNERTNTPISRDTRPAAISNGLQRSCSPIAPGRGAFNREISMPPNWPINYCCRIDADLRPLCIHVCVCVCTRAHVCAHLRGILVFLFLLSAHASFFYAANFAFRAGADVKGAGGGCWFVSLYFHNFNNTAVVCETKSAETRAMERNAIRHA